MPADFASIDIPVLTAVSQTMMLHGRAGFEAFSQLSSPSRQLLVLDASYTSYMYVDCRADIEAFFDRHLKEEPPGVEPPWVRLVMRTGAGGFEWRDETAWPIPGTEYRTLFLEAGTSQNDGSLTSHPPARTEAVEYSADVRAAEPELPMAVFESASLDEEMVLAGHFRVTLWVVSSSADADIFVALRIMDGDDEVFYQTRDPNRLLPSPGAV